MSKLTAEKKKHIMFVGLGTLVVIAMLYFFGVSGEKFALLDEQGRISEASAKADDAELWIKKATIIQAEFGRNREDLQAKETGMLPVTKNDWKVWLRTQLYNVATNLHHDVMLGEITLDPGEMNVEMMPNFPFQAARFKAPVTGYFADIGKYLADVENRFPYVRIENLTILPQSLAQPGAASNVEGSRSEKLVATFHVVALIRTGGMP